MDRIKIYQGMIFEEIKRRELKKKKLGWTNGRRILMIEQQCFKNLTVF